MRTFDLLQPRLRGTFLRRELCVPNMFRDLERDTLLAGNACSRPASSTKEVEPLSARDRVAGGEIARPIRSSLPIFTHGGRERCTATSAPTVFLLSPQYLLQLWQRSALPLKIRTPLADSPFRFATGADRSQRGRLGLAVCKML